MSAYKGRTRLVAIGALATLPLALLSGRAAAQSGGMAGMDMGTKISIPKGAGYTEADVRFMQGMIAHHSQAIYMSHLAAAHGVDPQVLKLAMKIDQSQVAEIRIMQEWLQRNHQNAPDTSSWHHIAMPGMLNAQQIAILDSARGPEFDRAFLVFMIQHHEGALKMVADLLNTPMAAQDVDVNVFANDVNVVQTAEIGIMHSLLDKLTSS